MIYLGQKIGIYRTVKSKGGNFVVKYCMNLSDEKKETAIKIALESKGNVRKRKIAVPLLMILGIVIIFSSIFFNYKFSCYFMVYLYGAWNSLSASCV